MQASRFNVQVPLPDRNEVFLMNTFSDAQLLVSPDVAALLERISGGQSRFDDEERDTVDALIENGFLVESRAEEPSRSTSTSTRFARTLNSCASQC